MDQRRHTSGFFSSIRNLFRLKQAQKRSIAHRQLNKARKEFRSQLKEIRKQAEKEKREYTERKDKEVEQEKKRIEIAVADLQIEQQRWDERNESLKLRIDQLEEEIAEVREVRARMEAGFSLVARALSLANSAMDDLQKIEKRSQATRNARRRTDK